MFAEDRNLAKHNRSFGEGQIWLGLRDGQSYARLSVFSLLLFTPC